MKHLLCLSSLLLATVAGAQTKPPAPTPAPPPPGVRPPATPTPAAPAPGVAAPRPAPSTAAVTARTGMALAVTNARGIPLQGITVQVSGPVEREGVTDASGMVRFLGLRVGTYRARFSGDEVTTLEKEVVVVRPGVSAEADAVLTPAPPPKVVEVPAPVPPPPAPVAAQAPVGPVGTPQVASLVEVWEAERMPRGQSRLETLLACSGNTRSTLVQLNGDQPQRLYEKADSLLYTVAGEATIGMSGRELTLAPGGFASIPRGVAFLLKRKGNKPFIALSVLAGEPCEQAK